MTKNCLKILVEVVLGNFPKMCFLGVGWGETEVPMKKSKVLLIPTFRNRRVTG